MRNIPARRRHGYHLFRYAVNNLFTAPPKRRKMMFLADGEVTAGVARAPNARPRPAVDAGDRVRSIGATPSTFKIFGFFGAPGGSAWGRMRPCEAGVRCPRQLRCTLRHNCDKLTTARLYTILNTKSTSYDNVQWSRWSRNGRVTAIDRSPRSRNRSLSWDLTGKTSRAWFRCSVCALVRLC